MNDDRQAAGNDAAASSHATQTWWEMGDEVWE